MEDKGAGAVGTLGHSWVVVVASCQSGPLARNLHGAFHGTAWAPFSRVVGFLRAGSPRTRGRFNDQASEVTQSAQFQGKGAEAHSLMAGATKSRYRNSMLDERQCGNCLWVIKSASGME